MAETTIKTDQYLYCTIGDEQYAISVSYVREVLVVPKITRIPKMPPYMRGVINLRGSIVPLVDLRIRFDMTETDISDDTAIIVLEIPKQEDELLYIGIFTDAVHSVISIDDSRLSPPPDIGTAIDTAFIMGMWELDGDFFVVLDIASLFATDELAILESVQADDESAE